MRKDTYDVKREIEIKQLPRGNDNKKLDFETLLRECFRCQSPEKQQKLKRAYLYLTRASDDEQLIQHSLEVARVVGVDIGLGTTSVIAALLHELPEKTDIQLEDLKAEFGQEIVEIIDGFYRIKNTESYFKPDDSQNAELYKNIVLNMARDLRIISLRIADRLVTLRHFERFAIPNKSIIPEETLKVYAPIADVLGSYRVKMELEDLAFKYYKPEIYQKISSQLKSSYRENTLIMNRVALPLIKELFDQGLKFKILSRQKSIYSIYRKLINKKLNSIDEIYDILAFRVILFSDPDLPHEQRLEQEKKLCRLVGQIAMDLYEVHPARIRNWIDKPKEGTGYMALHLTVRDQRIKRWVEIQIRGEVMHEIAEYGYAAHWKYKGVKLMLDQFAQQLKEVKRALENIDEDVDKVFELVEPLIPVEKISVYTPELKEYKLTKGATVLDFAAKVHSDLVKYILGAKINNSMTVSPTYKLNHGDIVQIVKSPRQIVPQREWLNKATTSVARRVLKQLLNIKDPKKKGLEKLFAIAKQNNMTVDSNLVKELMKKYNLPSKDELYVKIGNGEISEHEILAVLSRFRKSSFFNFVLRFSRHKVIQNYRLASCCNPKPGDIIVAVKMDSDTYEIHRIDCRMIEQFLEEQKELIPVEWKSFKQQSVLRILRIEAKDDIDLIYNISKTLYSILQVNIQTFSFHKDEKRNKYLGTIKFYISSERDLQKIIEKLYQIKSIIKIDVK